MKMSDDLLKLESIVGKNKLREICTSLKKRIIYFPRKKRPSRQIINLFGDQFQNVYEEFKGYAIYFPESIGKEIIKENIRIDYWKNNKSFSRLVKEYNRSIDNIRKICRKHPDNQNEI